MKGLQVTKKVRSYKKGTKLRKRYEVTKKIRSYEKDTKLRKRYEVTKQLRSLNLTKDFFSSTVNISFVKDGYL
jgi:hypothetical protein